MNCWFNLLAQDPINKNYSIQSGLPSNEAHFVISDHKGYVWVATDAGISRFDGVKFETYSLNEGLPESAVLRLYEDPKGRIWFSTISSFIGYIENGKVFFNQNRFKMKTDRELDENFAYSMYMDEGDTMWVSTLYSGLLFKLAPPYTQKPKQTNYHGSFLIEFNKKGDYLSGSGFYYPIINYYRPFKITYIKKWKKEKVVNNILKSPFRRSSLLNKLDDKHFIFDAKHEVFKTTGNKIETILRYKNKVLFTKIDRQKRLWVSVVNEGLYLYPDIDHLKNFQHFFVKEFVTHMTTDLEGGTWITTLFNGLIYVPNFNFKQVLGFSDNNRELGGMVPWLNQQLLVNKPLGDLLVIEDDKIVKKYPLKAFSFYGFPEQKKIYFYAIKLLDYRIHDLLDVSSGKSILRHTILSDYQYKNGGIIYKYFFKRNQKYYGLVHFWIHEFNSKTLSSKAICRSKNRINEFIIDKNDLIWLVCSKGLLMYDIRKKKWLEWGGKIKLLSTRMEKIVEDKNGNLWIGTRGMGLMVFDKRNKLTIINKNKGLNSNFIRYIQVDDANKIWVATNNGLNVIDGNNIKDIATFNFLNKYNLGVINELLIQGKELYATSTNGLFKFSTTDLLKLRSKKVMPIYITKVVSDQKIPLKQNPIVSYNHRFIKFSFTGISFLHGKEIEYEYKISGLDEKWHNTKSNFAEYYHLPAGQYTFRVRPVISDRNVNSTAIYSFSVAKPFWQSIWFLVTCILSAIFLLSLLIQWRIKKIQYNEREYAQKKILLATLEAKALRSQMNPHFIFNSLGSIQSYILQHESKLANHYLGKFSKLMRRILESSKHESISLRDEIDLITNYIELDKMRHNDHFEFEIECSQEIDLNNTYIPIMLIQPCVENAILHGLASLQDRKGKLIISIENEQECIKCTIYDNGIGRKASEKINQIKQKYHKSVSTSLTIDRLVLYNKMYHTNGSVSYEDLVDNTNESCGTKVILLIPKLKKHDLEDDNN